MNGHPAAVLRRAATLAPSVLPPALAEIAVDEIGIELNQLDDGQSADSIDERVLTVAEEILRLLPEDYAARAARETETAGWRPWSAEVAADVLHLVDTWSTQSPGSEAAILLRQIRELLSHGGAPGGAGQDRGTATPTSGHQDQSRACDAGGVLRSRELYGDFHDLEEETMIAYDDYLRGRGQRGKAGE